MSIKKERKIPQLLFDRILALKKKFLSLSIISKKINWKNRNKKKERLKWPWPHPLPKKTSRPLSSPCPCYVLCARKSCNHVQISIICLKCEFFLAKNWIVLNRMTKKLSSVLFFIYIHWVSKVLKYPKKCLEDLTTFSCTIDEGIPKIWKKLNSHGGFLRAD